jgi:hypothetical protein
MVLRKIYISWIHKRRLVMKNKKYFKPITRIKKVMEFYYKRGVNSERINNLYFKILKNE